MIFKIAKCPEDMIPLTFSMQGETRMMKTASSTINITPGSDTAKIIEAEISKHPTALFFRSKAIKANEPNSNGDYFSEDELKRAYKTFEGVPFFTNHDNQNVENARGKIIFAEWIPEEKSIYTISFVDREAYPHICRSIEEEYITGVSMGAVSGGTKILMADNTEKNIENVKAGDIVVSHTGLPRKVKSVHNEYLGKKMYSFDLETYHRSPLFTNDHPILTIGKEQLQESRKLAIAVSQSNKYERRMGKTEESIGQDTWRNAKYNPDFKHTDTICEGDYFLVPSKFRPGEGSSVDSDLYYIMGAYLGDGYLKKDKNGDFEAVSFCLGLDEIELAAKITKILKKYTNSEVSSVICQERNGLYLNFYDRKLAKQFHDLMGTGSKDKRIKFFLKYNEDAINLINGYLDTDGCIVDKTNQDVRGNKFGGMQISSANIGLLEDVQSLLISLGCVSRISTADRIPGKNSVVKVNTTEYTLAVGSNASSLFTSSIKLSNYSGEKGAEIKAGRTFITEIDGLKYMVCPVKNIDITDYNEPVYDLTVEEDESYIADGVAVHNCSVEYSVCNICGNKAEKTDDYCSHIKERKGRTFSGKARNVTTGETKEFNKEPVFEYNYGIKFIELSAVVDPACPSCRIQGLIKNDDIVKKVATIQNNLYMVRTAAIEKKAGAEDIQQLNDTLKTLEGISIKLIQNRQQVEVGFASDLVGILSELQTFVDELVGAGYGNVQGAIPGVTEAPPGTPGVPGAMPELPPAGLPAEAQPVGLETPLASAPSPAPSVGSVSGAPGTPLVKSPKLPITAPAKPRAFDSTKMQKIAKTLENLMENSTNKGEDDMGKRLTVEAKIKQKKVATETLSNSWQEKHDFFEYINRVPSVQDNSSKLSIKKREDSFIIVAESKNNNEEGVWTYETLSEQEKEMIKSNPKAAAEYFLNKFASNLKNKKGETEMTSNIKEAGAKSVNKAPEVVTEAQLEEKGLYHSRTGEDKNQITERQLDDKRTGVEKEVVTEAQLNEKSNKLNPRTGTEAEVIIEKQLESDNVSPRSEAPTQVTQAQLETYRTGNEADVVTERQLDSVDAPWTRAATRNPSLFKSAGDHMKSVVDVLANTVISTGCTPIEVTQVASSLVASTKDRFELGNAILNTSKDDDVNYSTRLAYWSKKNIKVAGTGTKEIADTLIKGLQKVACDVTINPETIIDALDVVSEGKEGSDAISESVDKKLASAQKETIKASKKDELRKALASSLASETKVAVDQTDAKISRDVERAMWSKTAKKADTVVETSFAELGCTSKDEPTFKSTIKSFARGALASQNIKLAAITNVTISGDTISIAVQTDAGEQGIEIPVGQEIAPTDAETMPEADLTGEGLEANMGAPSGIDPVTGLPTPTASSKQTLKKQAQIGGQGGGIPGTPGGVTAPGAPEAGIPGATPTDMPVQSLTTDEEENEIPDEIPTAGQQQPLGAICPECGTSDVDLAKGEDGNSRGTCNSCGAEYEVLVKKEIEFKIIKPTKSVGAEETTGAPEAPEVPALPVAAQTKLDKGSIVRIASNKEKNGHVCPACGMKQCKASKESEGHTEYHCPACNSDVQKDVMVNVNDPEESYLRVKWDMVPNTQGCSGCKEAAAKFASMIKVQGLVKQASSATTKFPMANCIERIARKHGGNAVASFGPCKGQPLADCVCGQLEKLGMNKVRHLEKLASVYTQKDPMDECIADQMKNKYARKEAVTICNCLKKKFASKSDDNPFLMAFADDIKSGKEKMLTAQDMDAVNDMFSAKEDEAPMVDEDVDIDIGEPLEVLETPEAETVTLEVSIETAQELADAAKVATEVEVEAPAEVSEEVPAEVKIDAEVENVGGELEEEKDMALAMQTHKIIRVGEEVIKVAATPTKVKDIEGNVEAKVPRSEQKLGDESKADSLMNKPNKGPDVPRGNAYMGKEKEADSLINKELKLPDVAVDSSYMGKEKEIQSGMPAINNEIKGTVIAQKDKTVKEAKKMKEVDTVEKDVEAKVPRSEQKLGEEAKADSLINEPNKGPDVPRAKATMGKEGPDNIDVKMDAPDVPIDSAYMGKEKETQKGMPAINDEYLKNVQQKKDIQLERIVMARRMKAVETAAKLLATKRINEEAYDNVIEALSKFEIDRIASVADSMYPKVMKQAATQDTKEVHAGTAIVMESKDIKTSNSSNDLATKLASAFTTGSRSFDESLTHYGLK